MRNEAKPKRRIHPFFLSRNITLRNPSSNVTLISQMSMMRVRMLEPLCQHWTGPMSISVYTSDENTAELIDYYSNHSCLKKRENIAIHVVYEDGLYYPYNYLRNVALDHMTSQYVFLLDIDFLPMFDLHDYLLEAAHRELHVATKKRALVVAAFQAEHFDVEFPLDKTALKKMLKAKSITLSSTRRGQMHKRQHNIHAGKGSLNHIK